MVIPIVLFLLQTLHLPLRAVSSHTTSFLSFCIFSYILPHRVKRYFRFFEVFLFFISDISPQAPPFYPIPPLFTSLEGWYHSESRLVGTEESGGRGVAAPKDTPATGGNKISARPERVEGFQRKSGLIHRRYGSTGFVHPEHDEGLNERMKAFSVSRRRYGSTSSPRTAWRIIYPSPDASFVPHELRMTIGSLSS